MAVSSPVYYKATATTAGATLTIPSYLPKFARLTRVTVMPFAGGTTASTAAPVDLALTTATSPSAGYFTQVANNQFKVGSSLPAHSIIQLIGYEQGEIKAPTQAYAGLNT